MAFLHSGRKKRCVFKKLSISFVLSFYWRWWAVETTLKTKRAQWKRLRRQLTNTGGSRPSLRNYTPPQRHTHPQKPTHTYRRNHTQPQRHTHRQRHIRLRNLSQAQSPTDQQNHTGKEGKSGQLLPERRSEVLTRFLMRRKIRAQSVRILFGRFLWGDSILDAPALSP